MRRHKKFADRSTTNGEVQANVQALDRSHDKSVKQVLNFTKANIDFSVIPILGLNKGGTTILQNIICKGDVCLHVKPLPYVHQQFNP